MPLSLSCQQDSAKGKEKRKKKKEDKNREQEGIRVMTKITVVLFPSHMAQVQTCYCTLFPFFHPSM
jgi:hypothetical protein